MKLRVWLVTVLLTTVAVVACGWLTMRPVPDVPVYSGKLQFQSEPAMKTLAGLVLGYPQRDDLHAGRAASAEWIENQFRSYGLSVHTQVFSEVINGKKVDGLKNVYAVKAGRSSDAILVLAHYDIPPFVRQGAADDASGVAVVLELARVFAAEPVPARTIIFLASDSEEYGAMQGSFAFLDKSGWGGRLATVVTLDYANMGDMKGVKVRSMGIHKGYAPLWLRQTALSAAALEAQAFDIPPVMEWVERSVAISPSEQGVYLRAGIPAVNLSTLPVDPAWQAARFHTPSDTLENIKPSTIFAYGRSAERLIRTIQEMKQLPPGDMFYFKLNERSYLPGWSLRLIQFLALIPLGVGTLAAWRHYERSRRTGGTVGSEVGHLLALFGAGALGYLSLWLCSERGLMTKFELYPATQKDPVLDHPQVVPILLTIGVIIASYFVLSYLLRRGRINPLLTMAVSMTTLFGLAVVATILDAGFLVLALLGPALLLWPLARPSRNPWWRLANAVVALSAVVVFVAFMVLFRQLYSVGQIGWYLLMCTAYGLFRPRAILAFLLAGAAIIRFFRSSVSEPGPS